MYVDERQSIVVNTWQSIESESVNRLENANKFEYFLENLIC